MIVMAHDKEIRELLRLVRPMGVRMADFNRKHKKLVDREGNFIIAFSSSPSDRMAFKNIYRDLVRKGYLINTGNGKNYVINPEKLGGGR